MIKKRIVSAQVKRVCAKSYRCISCPLREKLGVEAWRSKNDGVRMKVLLILSSSSW